MKGAEALYSRQLRRAFECLREWDHCVPAEAGAHAWVSLKVAATPALMEGLSESGSMAIGDFGAFATLDSEDAEAQSRVPLDRMYPAEGQEENLVQRDVVFCIARIIVLLQHWGSLVQRLES